MYLVNDRPLASAKAAPFAATWDSTRTFDGPKVVNSCAIDQAGNATAAPYRLVKVDNVPGEQALPVYATMITPDYAPNKNLAVAMQPSVSFTGRYVAFTGAGLYSFVADDTNNSPSCASRTTPE